MTEYTISRASGCCAVSGRAFEAGEEFYSVIVEAQEGLERRDYSLAAWEGPPPGALCHFKTRLPAKEEARRTFVDDEVLINFFQRLAGAEDALKQRFRFVLALILLRKRLLKYERTVREPKGEHWDMRLVRDKTLHRVFNPVMNDREIEQVSGELSAILHGAPIDADPVVPADPPDDPPAPHADPASVVPIEDDEEANA